MASKLAVALLLGVLLGAFPLGAQQAASVAVSGTVLDESGAPLAGALVTARNLATNRSWQSSVSSSGAFSFAGLEPGLFELRASLIGFGSQTLSDVRLGAGETPVLSFVLRIVVDVEVVTASRRQRRISRSPAIISTISGRELAERGIVSLYDALSFLPGVEVMETYYGYTDIVFRGILQDHYNNKAALLLNSQPLYDQVVSTFYLEQIPISSVERIEVVRGPGGVLYGTNAYAGVINIITRTGEQADGAEGSFRTGSFTTRNAQLMAGKLENGVDLFLAAAYNDSRGYRKSVAYDEDDERLGVPFGHSSAGSRQLGFYSDAPDGYEDDYTSLFGSVGYKGFKLNGAYFENQKDKFGIVPTLVSTGERTVRGFGLNLKYEKRGLAADRLALSAIGWHDAIDKQERVNLYPPVLRAPGAHPDDQQYGGRKSGGQFELDFSASPKVGLLAGAGFERSHADPYYFFLTEAFAADGARIQDQPANAFKSPHDTTDVWAYAQAEVAATPSLELVGGARFNHNAQAGSAVIPSLGLVYSRGEQFSLKLLYGEGFRNPSFFEKYVRTVNVLAGVNDLEPEKIRTVDVGLAWLFGPSYSVRLNAFYMKSNDLISRRTLTAADLSALNAEPGFGSADLRWTRGAIYENRPGQSYRGVELELTGRPSSRLSVFANATYKKGKESSGQELLFFAPVLANLGLTYKPSSWVRFSPSLQYVGRRKGHYQAINPWNRWPEADYTLDGYALLDLNVTVLPLSGLSLSIQGRNLLDEDYAYPEYIRRGIPSIPGGPGRAVYLTVGLTL